MRLWRVLQAFIMLSADGVMVCAFVSCRAVCCWYGELLALLLSTDGVRMARTGFSVCRYIFIY